ncbi:carbohydrate ABC transporter permease [Haloplasma contractile]|uniref:Binding-protein-dependent transport systems inner membrane component n=1 Tax=Haloplasma contractile SSD-17B TaxID=1033810 RepID=U2FK42_9MOLU|nr:sugar ABC transporter permease [Haloplasma contractile]ERJ11599.1 Binding-protein-dependent transport systems inner membrane component [Haloplasma contractile SSD-17B]
MKAKQKKKYSINRKHNIAGYSFMAPWLLGFILFTALPFLYTIYLSFTVVDKTVRGWNMTWVGMDNYLDSFLVNTNFPTALLDFVIKEVVYVPTIIIISFILAVLLNQKIKFRAGFRMIYFLPVIILSGSVMQQLMDAGTTEIEQITDIFVFRIISNYSPIIAEGIGFLFNEFSIILWFTGIPIVLYINGLQKINRSLYEAAQIDGANAWQTLWKITIPMIKSTALVASIYTIVQLGLYNINPVYGVISESLRNNQYGFAATYSWVFTLVVLLLIGIVFFILGEREKVLRKEDIREKQAKKLRKIQRRNQMRQTITFKKIFKTLINTGKNIKVKKESEGGETNEEKTIE